MLNDPVDADAVPSLWVALGLEAPTSWQDLATAITRLRDFFVSPTPEQEARLASIQDACAMFAAAAPQEAALFPVRRRRGRPSGQTRPIVGVRVVDAAVVRFASLAEAGAALGDMGSISRSARDPTGVAAHGYVWRYEVAYVPAEVEPIRQKLHTIAVAKAEKRQAKLDRKKKRLELAEARAKGEHIKHGTTLGYSNHGCRCSLCREANRIRCGEYARRKAAEKAAAKSAERLHSAMAYAENHAAAE